MKSTRRGKLLKLTPNTNLELGYERIKPIVQKVKTICEVVKRLWEQIELREDITRET